MSRVKFRLAHLLAATTLMLEVTASFGFPSLYPTGTTISQRISYRAAVTSERYELKKIQSGELHDCC